MNQIRNTILAALRLLQREGTPVDLMDIATNSGETELMAGREIDTLCERLNCGMSLYIYIRVYLRPPGHPKGSPHPAFTHTFVQADSDDTAYDLGSKDPLDAELIADGYAPANDYVIACGPMLQDAYCDGAALVVVRGGVAEVVENSCGDIRIIDIDNINAGDPPAVLPRGEGFEELLGDTLLEEGAHFQWE